MANSYNSYVGDGVTDIYAITFEYLSTDDVTVLVDGESVDFSWLSATSVQTDEVPASDAVVKVLRTTDTTIPVVDFTDGSTLLSEDLDDSLKQLRLIAQETNDTAASSLLKNASLLFDAGGIEIVNLGAPLTDNSAIRQVDLDTALSQTGNLPLSDTDDNGSFLVVSEGDWAKATAGETRTAIGATTAYWNAAQISGKVVDLTGIADGYHLIYRTGSGTFEVEDFDGHVHAAADITSGTFADALVAESNVTQHEAALTITESQISDLGSYSVIGHAHATSDITSGTFADARVAESNVTQHQAALSITESQISDFGTYSTTSHTHTSSDITDSATGSWNALYIDGVSIDTTGIADGKILKYSSSSGNWEIDDDVAETGSGTDHGTLTGLGDDDHSQYILAAGTRALTGDWDAGSYDIQAETFTSDVTTGTAPLVIASTTLVSNLNADLLDGNEATAFASASHTHTESDITDLGTYLEDVTGEPVGDLSDVTVTTLGDGEVLVSASGVWINQTLAEAGISATSHTHSTADITSGTLADARVAESNVTQHEAAIDHDALTNFSAAEHRTINDAGAAATDLWSADKITTELAAITGSHEYILAVDEKSDGTDGGTFTTGAWRTRDLNTLKVDEDGGASIATNQLTLPAGTYYVHATAPAGGTNVHQARLYDTTGTAVLLNGTTETTTSAYSAQINTRSHVIGKFTLSVESVIELQHQGGSSRSTDGFGHAANFGNVETYSTIQLWKVA